MADDVAGFIEDHGLQKSTLIGHSMFVFLSLSPHKMTSGGSLTN